MNGHCLNQCKAETFKTFIVLSPEPYREREERSGEVVRDTTFGESKKERIYIFGFEGSQAVPTRPSGRGSAFNWD
jgi:hypothetical protein